jgi:hypothetical protein
MIRSLTVKSAGATLTALGSAVFIMSAPALADSEADQQPPVDGAANEGFVMVDGKLLEEIADEQAHVGCTFRVDFYNYDEGVGEAFVDFTMQAPTQNAGVIVSGDTSPDIGTDPAGGSDDLDASVTYTLTFDGEPDPDRGFRVRVDIGAPGSHRSDEKHKVFWVTPCATTTTTTTVPTTAPTTTVPSSTAPTTSSTTPPATTTPTTPPTSPPPAVETTTTTDPTTAPPSEPGSTTVPPTDFDAGVAGGPAMGGPNDGAAETDLAGRSPWALAGVLGGLALAGTGLTMLGRRRVDDAA